MTRRILSFLEDAPVQSTLPTPTPAVSLRIDLRVGQEESIKLPAAAARGSTDASIAGVPAEAVLCNGDSNTVLGERSPILLLHESAAIVAEGEGE